MVARKTSPDDHSRAASYFDRSGQLFDSLYSLEKTSKFMRVVNKMFRRDIYDRYALTLEHLKRVSAKSVLDVGVGGARYAQGYINCGIERVVGVDISSTMLDFAKKHVKDMDNHEQIFEFVLSDIDVFETDERFDVVVAMGLFDYITNAQATLQKLRTLCKHSLIASFPGRSIYRTPIRKVRYRFKKCPVFFFNRDQITRLSEQAGFTSCDITKIPGSGMDYVAIFKR